MDATQYKQLQTVTLYNVGLGGRRDKSIGICLQVELFPTYIVIYNYILCKLHVNQLGITYRSYKRKRERKWIKDWIQQNTKDDKKDKEIKTNKSVNKIVINPSLSIIILNVIWSNSSQKIQSGWMDKNPRLYAVNKKEKD